MSAIPIHIVLHGMIALVPMAASSTAPSSMTALVVDGSRPIGGIECFAEHFPKLTLRASNDVCLAAGCEVSGSTSCSCTAALKGHQVTLVVQPPIPPPVSSSAIKASRTQLARTIPFDTDSAGDFRYFANLSLMNQTVNPTVFGAAPPDRLTARMTFPLDSLAACSFATRRDDGADNVHEMGFRPLGSEEQESDVSQAVAQKLVATAMVPDGPAPAQSATIELADFDGSNVHRIPLMAGLQGYFIELENERARPLPTDDRCDDGIGRDFAFYYELAASPPAPAQRPLPHVKPTHWKSLANLESQACNPGKGGMSKPICAMASFNP